MVRATVMALRAIIHVPFVAIEPRENTTEPHRVMVAKASFADLYVKAKATVADTTEIAPLTKTKGINVDTAGSTSAFARA